jgi:hypothetical protein
MEFGKLASYACILQPSMIDIHAHPHPHKEVYIYIYIYIERERERFKYNLACFKLYSPINKLGSSVHIFEIRYLTILYTA